MKTQDFIHETTGIADVLGRSDGVKVIFEGDQAYTDGKEIVIPSLPQGHDMNAKAVEVIRGYMDHESAHIRSTDWEVSKVLFEECERDKRPALKDIVNCVEDMFIEREQMEYYPGTRKNFISLSEENDRVGLEHIDQVDLTSVNLPTVAAGILLKGREDYGGKYNTELWDMLPDKIKAHAEVWKTHVDKVQNTTDSIRLAKSIYKLIHEDPELDSNPEDFDPNDDDLSGVPEGDGPMEGQAQQQKVSQDGKETLEKLMGESSDEQEGEPSDEEGEEGDIPNIGKPQGEKVEGYRILSTRWDEVLSKKVQPMKHSYFKSPEGTHEDYAKYKSKVQSKVTVMKSKLQRVLASKEMRDWDFAREQGRLDTKRLPSAIMGNRNVYKVRKDREEMDTAVEVLVDCSGSMVNSKIKMARDVAIVLAECFEGTGIKYEISGFTSGRSSDPAYHELLRSARNSGVPYHRASANIMYLFKEFSEKLRSAKPAISNMSELQLASNADRDAILWAHARLKGRPEKRKVLIVLSDGNPACSTLGVHFESLARAAKEAVLEASKTVEVLGIGIQDDAVEGIYPKSVVVYDLDELPTKIMREISKILLDNKLNM